MLLHQTSSIYHALNPIDGHGSYPLTCHEWTINHYKSPSLVLKSKLLRSFKDTPINWGPKKLEKAPHPMISKVIFLHFRTSAVQMTPCRRPRSALVLLPLRFHPSIAHKGTAHTAHRRSQAQARLFMAVSSAKFGGFHGNSPRIAGWYWFIRESPIKLLLGELAIMNQYKPAGSYVIFYVNKGWWHMMTQGPTSCPPTGFICTFAGKSSNIDPFSDKPKCSASVVSSHDLSVSRRNVGNVKHIANVTLLNHTSIGIVGSCLFSLCCAPDVLGDPKKHFKTSVGTKQKKAACISLSSQATRFHFP